MICASGAALAALTHEPLLVTLVFFFWFRGIITVCGVKVEIEALENLTGLKSYVLVADGQRSFASAALVPGHRRFVAKKNC